ncbi:MAG: hypothetical protein HZB56_23235 [Deltaproteobacteria bacterium]|nr:hypothetical protein [Deltaproteobacteria bacterium]
MRALAAAALALAACQAPGLAARSLPPLAGEGEVFLYLDPLPAAAERLSFALEWVAAVRADGLEVPLTLGFAEVDGAKASRQRLLASGRLPPGSYTSLAVKVRRATLVTEDGRTDLLVSREPDRVPVALPVSRGHATVLTLALRFSSSVSASYGFAPAFAAQVPHAPQPALSAYCTSDAASAVAVLDRRRRQVVAVLPTGRAPQGIAVDALQGRAYVALSGEDTIQVIDLASREDLPPMRLQPGDRPGDLALTQDGRTLLAVNAGSRTLAFLDPASGMERGRVPVGEEPQALLLDRSGRRAYVANRRSARITVIDVANRAVVGALATDPEPTRMALNRAGTRLYAIHAGSAQLGVWSLPDLRPVARQHVGLGATALKVDPRTDLVYVGRRDRRLEIYDPLAFTPVDAIALPGVPGWLAIDDAENLLLALLPEEGSLVAVDLTARRVVAAVDVLPDPHAVAFAGERN